MTETDKDPIEQMLNFVKTASKEEIRKFFGYYEPTPNLKPSIMELVLWQEPSIANQIFNPLNYEQTK